MSLSVEELDNLSELLLSVDDTNTEIAFEILSGQELCPEELFTEVFVVYKLTDSTVLQEKAMTFLEQHGVTENSLIIRSKSHLKTSGGATEKRIKTNITDYINRSNGKLNGVKMARAMLNKYKVGLQYLLDNATVEEQHKLLESFMEGTIFRLNEVSLTKVPNTLYDFTELTEIDLSVNDLKTVPVKFKAFVNLEKLILRNNKLTKLPKTILSLKKLSYLDISSNNFSAFPAELCKMTALTHLYFDDMNPYFGEYQKFDVPEEFKNLPNLQELNISSYTWKNNLKNPLLNYPNFSKLTSQDGKPLDLTPLKIAEQAYLTNGNDEGIMYLLEHSQDKELLTKIIKEQFYKESTETLDFNEKVMTCIPQEFGDFNAKEVLLSRCYLGGIIRTNGERPEEYSLSIEEVEEKCNVLHKWSEVEKIDLSNNYLSAIPSAVLGWESLKELDLSSNYLDTGAGRDFVDENTGEVFSKDSYWSAKGFEKLKNLETLILSHNRVKLLPSSIKYLEKLRVLKLGSNDLISLPSEIQYLTCLEELDLSYNHDLEDLPKEIVELKNLKKLMMSFGLDQEIPSIIGSLESLEELVIKMDWRRSNDEPMYEIPSSFSELKNLKKLTFTEERFTSYYNKNHEELKEKYLEKLSAILPSHCEIEM